MVKLSVAVMFGGRSPEHEVSIVTAFQAWEWIDPKKYNCYLIYLDRDNHAYLCPLPKKKDYRRFIKNVVTQDRRVEFIQGGFRAKRKLLKKKIDLDIAFLCMHGNFGEDGSLQGMLEYLDIAYTGSGVLGSALSMDKVLAKRVFSSLGLPVIPYYWFHYKEFGNNSKKIKKEIEQKLTAYK